MSSIRNNSHDGFYYSGGFSEIVFSPTMLTYSFLKDWFSGAGSLGKAMDLLKLPYSRNYHPLLELVEHELLLNLKIEELTLYEDTIFSYRKQDSINSLPKLSVKAGKLISPLNWKNTLGILTAQSRWISKPEFYLDKAKSFVANIPEFSSEDTDLEKIDQILKDEIWPKVLAVGFLSEFYSQLLFTESKEKSNMVQSYVSSKTSSRDWYFLSLKDQIKVKKNEMTFDNYINKYGLRADKDYELTSQRWHEIPEIIKERIENAREIEEKNPDEVFYGSLSEKLKKLINISIEFQLLRSEAKRKTLVSIDLLRQFIIKDFCDENCSHGDGCKLNSKVKKKKLSTQGLEIKALVDHVSEGSGIAISEGEVSGIIKHISDHDIKIPNGTIGIFSNSSPEFSMEFPKCVGIIFLRGGTTSHGATVAREYGIPALVDEKAQSLSDGLKITIDGGSGKWRITKPKDEIADSKDQKNSYERYLKNLKGLNLNDKNIGGKARSLGQLLAWEIPVPDGFVITSNAFADFYEKEIPKGLEKLIIDAYRKLNFESVAVRSSALSEDSKISSWAGQLESYLNVTEENLIENIIKCWKSILSPRAKSYANNHDVKEENLKVAVIVQVMIKGDVSGVVFTKNPVSGNDNEIIIEADFGLAENVVGGEVTPARYVVDKKSFEIKNSEEIGNSELINPEDLNKLCKLSLMIEEKFGNPQDIEWTLKNHNIYILQSRPITT